MTNIPKHISQVSFDLKVVTYWTYHKQFTTVCTDQDFSFVEPHM